MKSIESYFKWLKFISKTLRANMFNECLPAALLKDKLYQNTRILSELVSLK